MKRLDQLWDIYVTCYSDKADVSIDFGISDIEGMSLDDLGTDWIFNGLGDSFWENAYQFEDGVSQAYALCYEGKEIDDALYEVFGHFSIEFKCNIPGITPDFNITEESINNAIYAMLRDV